MQVRPGSEYPDRLNLGWILQLWHGRVAKLGGGACISTLSVAWSESVSLALLSVFVFVSLGA